MVRKGNEGQEAVGPVKDEKTEKADKPKTVTIEGKDGDDSVLLDWIEEVDGKA